MPAVTAAQHSPSDYPAELYVALHAGHPGDIEFYVRACSGAQSVLELGCGDARVLASLAAHCPELTGLEIDPSLVELAQTRAHGLGLDKLQLVQGDMRAFDLGRQFDVVTIPFGGLYCMLDDSALAQCLSCIARHLRPGGRLIADAWAADDFHAEHSPDDCEDGWIDRAGTVEVGGKRYEVLERSSWDRGSQRLDVHYLHVEVGTENSIEAILRQRYVLREQLESALAAAGFGGVRFFGDFEGATYGTQSELMVVEARR